MELEICQGVCKAEFRKGTLDENGICPTCAKLFPNGKKNKDELEKENEGRMANVIEKLVNEMLVKYGILFKCDCGNFFYKRSPAQKQCQECKGDKETN